MEKALLKKVEQEKTALMGFSETGELSMPDIPDFRVQGTFRLWISTQAMEELPLGWLQDCHKIVLEPVRGLKLNAIKTLNSTPPDFWRAGAGEDLLIPFRQLYFALTFYHALMSGRDRFSSLGWSRPQEFSPADHRISSLQVLSLVRECDVPGTG